MIIRVWGSVDGVDVVYRPLPGRDGYWYCDVAWHPQLYHVEIWAENDKGARGHLACEVAVRYSDDVHTRCQIVLYPLVAKLITPRFSWSEAGRGEFIMESVSYRFGEAKSVRLAVLGTNREAFEVTNAHWMLKNGDEIESEGECSLEAPRSDRWILDTGPIRPMRPDNYYVLEFSYDVIDDHLIHAVGLRTVGGQNGK